MAAREEARFAARTDALLAVLDLEALADAPVQGSLMVRERFNLILLLVEHHMDLVMRVSDKVVALHFGRKIADGTPDGMHPKWSAPISAKRYERAPRDRESLLETGSITMGGEAAMIAGNETVRRVYVGY